MKKVSFFAIVISVFLVLISCGTTENVATSPQPPKTAEEAVTQTYEDVANEIAGEMNALSQPQESAESSESEIPSEEANAESEQADSEHSQQPEESLTSDTTEPAEATEIAESVESSENAEIAEKVSEEDSNLNKLRENAPTTDERGRVSEYPIFEEPEVVVLDLPEEEPVAEVQEMPSEPHPEETEPQTAENPPEEAATTPPVVAETPQQSTASQSQSAPAQPQVATTQAASPAQSESEKPSEDSEQTKPEDESESVVPSRSVAVKINQYLDVTYPGKGWTYIGEVDKTGLFNFFGRKLGSNNTTFSLRAKKAGNTILHFYKNDALTGEYIDDYLAVTVENKKSAGRVKAPSYADIVPAQPQRRIERAQETAQQESKQTTSPQAPAAEKQDSAKSEATASKPASNSQKSEQSAATKSASSQSQMPQNQTVSQNQAQPASAQPKTASQAQTSSQNQANRTSQNNSLATNESDVKTVIQTTEPTTPNATTSPQSSQASSQTQGETDVQSQSFEYTPTSSQSTRTEDSSIQTEPEVQASQEDPWKTDRSASAHSSDESLLEKAKQDFIDGKFEDALKEAQEYYNTASTRLDEALFLLGQISESNSSVKDIRFAVDSYDMLVKRFPASKLWKQAKNRSIYLKRFYIDIR